MTEELQSQAINGLWAALVFSDAGAGPRRQLKVAKVQCRGDRMQAPARSPEWART